MRHIRMSKYAAERLPLTINMQGRCASGETISTATVTATVGTGTDPTPAAIIDGPASVINGQEVRQFIKDGLPGVTYNLQVAAVTSLGSTYIDRVVIAVLPTVT